MLCWDSWVAFSGGGTFRFIGGGRGPRHIIYTRGDGVSGPGVGRSFGKAGPAVAWWLGGLALSKNIRICFLVSLTRR